MSINIALVPLQLHGPIRQSLRGHNMLYDTRSEFSLNTLQFELQLQQLQLQRYNYSNVTHGKIELNFYYISFVG